MKSSILGTFALALSGLALPAEVHGGVLTPGTYAVTLNDAVWTLKVVDDGTGNKTHVHWHAPFPIICSTLDVDWDHVIPPNYDMRSVLTGTGFCKLSNCDPSLPCGAVGPPMVNAIFKQLTKSKIDVTFPALVFPNQPPLTVHFQRVTKAPKVAIEDGVATIIDPRPVTIRSK